MKKHQYEITLITRGYTSIEIELTDEEVEVVKKILEKFNENGCHFGMEKIIQKEKRKDMLAEE